VIRPGFVIDSLPRTGSTTLAHLLACHPDIKCLIEPFHPRRYDGQFHRMASDQGDCGAALRLMWHKWSGIKHVWESSGKWPFSSGRVNDSVVLSGGPVVFIERRNWLRRYVSGLVSQQLAFWVGTRKEFIMRLERAELKPVDSRTAGATIAADKAAVAMRLNLLREHKVCFLHVFYEDMFEHASREKQFDIYCSIVDFLGFRKVSRDELGANWLGFLEQDNYRWASEEIYRLLPGSDALDRELGSPETGWLMLPNDVSSAQSTLAKSR
jgi:hypothetical protein